MTVSQENPWIHRSFWNDSRVRVKERYWRLLGGDDEKLLLRREENKSEEETRHSPLYVVDAATWRIYLPLLQKLSDDNCHFVLLESVAELLDYLASSTLSYAPSSRERTIMTKMAQQGRLQVFCDLAVRERDDDDFDWIVELPIRDRSRHALLRAARLLRNDNAVLVVNEDSEFFTKNNDNVDVVFLHRLVDKITLSPRRKELLELKEACEQDFEQRQRKEMTQSSSSSKVIDKELTEEEIQRGLDTKQFLRGRLVVSSDNAQEAFVTVNSNNKTYFVDKQHRRRAFHHDIVLIEILPCEQWARPVGRHRLVHHVDDEDEDDSAVDLLIPTVPSARVVAVTKPSRRVFCCTMLDPPKESDSHVLVTPMDVKIPKIRIHARSAQNYGQQRLKVQVDGWEVSSKYPSGRCIEILGPIGDLETELTALLLENQVELDPFSTAALACLPQEDWAIPSEEISRRKDLRSSRQIFSVDPPGCQDIDDSMHVYELPNGDIEIGVHIADVTYFVQHNSALDREAQVRGTTFYLVDRRFDMLPSVLSSNLCSLHGGVDRLAVSAIWVLSKDFSEVKSTWFGRTVIHNCAAMTYDQADNILQGKLPETPGTVAPPPLTAGAPVDPGLIDSLKKALSTLTSLARKLRNDREKIGGAVDLSSGDLGSELKFTLDENGKPTRVVPKADKEIHHTIAELMILANTSVATKIYDAFPDSALLRRHQSVDEERFGELRHMLEAAGISFDGASNLSLAESLKTAKKSRGMTAYVDALLRSLATRAMSEALYFCTGEDQTADLSHYGLGLSLYTHFTSPIRRYADVVVHKQLLAALLREQTPSVLPLKVDHSKSQRRPLDDLPESNVISVLAGEGLEDEGDFDEDVLDSLIEGASELVLGEDRGENEDDSPPPSQEPYKPYNTADVIRICEGLNLHNRLAKYSSSECQRLFLGLYFRDNVEMTQAVVLNLKANGFYAYIPRFDMRLAVYVRDALDQVQIDPSLLGLPRDAGLPATVGFSGSSCRLFPNGTSELFDGPDERLAVSVPGASKQFILRPLDVVKVKLTCDDWDIRARVPTPRAQLLGDAAMGLSGPSSKDNKQAVVTIDSKKLQSIENSSNLETRKRPGDERQPCTMFEVFEKLTVRPDLDEEQHRSCTPKTVTSNRSTTLPGRFAFGGFVNPDTRIAQQEAAQQAAAMETAQRREKLAARAVQRNEYDSTKRVERNVMGRQQRLAAEKRNARRGKAK